MLLSILMTEEMHRMQYGNWTVRMVGELNYLTIPEVEVEDVEEGVVALVVDLT